MQTSTAQYSEVSSKKKTVRFDSATLRLYDKPEYSNADVFYTEEESAYMRKEDAVLVRLMEMGALEMQGICFRGLENRTKTGLRRVLKVRAQALNAVLDEVERQIFYDDLDVEMISRIYRGISSRSALRAREIGEQDAIDAQAEDVPATPNAALSVMTGERGGALQLLQKAFDDDSLRKQRATTTKKGKKWWGRMTKKAPLPPVGTQGELHAATTA
eukprot:Nitzschia sp. Nitz4//scaffold106_size73319//66492//67139//NITZ4_005748-RA/size73319-processed-gene-0.73-mRNA-1//-1//CDS//3329532556//8262//frame0